MLYIDIIPFCDVFNGFLGKIIEAFLFGESMSIGRVGY